MLIHLKQPIATIVPPIAMIFVLGPKLCPIFSRFAVDPGRAPELLRELLDAIQGTYSSSARSGWLSVAADSTNNPPEILAAGLLTFDVRVRIPARPEYWAVRFRGRHVGVDELELELTSLLA